MIFFGAKKKRDYGVRAEQMVQHTKGRLNQRSSETKNENGNRKGELPSFQSELTKDNAQATSSGYINSVNVSQMQLLVWSERWKKQCVN